MRTGMAFTMNTDDAGRVWFGYPWNVVAVWSGGKVRTFGEAEGLNMGCVFVIAGRGRNVWVGGERGLAMLVGNRFRSISGKGGPGFRMITGIVELPNGDLWLHGASGVARVSAAEVRQTCGLRERQVA